MNLLGTKTKPANIESGWFKSGRDFDLGQAEYVAIKRGGMFKVLYDQTTMLYLTESHVSLQSCREHDIVLSSNQLSNLQTFQRSNPAANMVTSICLFVSFIISAACSLTLTLSQKREPHRGASQRGLVSFGRAGWVFM